MRLIDADKADVETISCHYGASCDIDDVKEWLDAQPTVDAVEVTRCKDCTHSRKAVFEQGKLFCRLRGCYMGETEFCSSGERKEH